MFKIEKWKFVIKILLVKRMDFNLNFAGRGLTVVLASSFQVVLMAPALTL